MEEISGAAPSRRGLLGRGLALGGGLLLAQGCAQMPASQALGTPAGPIARESFAALFMPGAGLGTPLGAAVAVDDTHLLTAAHVLPSGLSRLTLLHGDGTRQAEARVVARSAHTDLAVLRTAPGFMRPAPIAERRPRPGDAVWAAGLPNFGAPVASGSVARPRVEVEGMGRGFTAHMPALMGYSGGPVVDGSARLVGVTSAVLNPGAARLLGLLTGMDLDGMARGAGREVFVMEIGLAMAEMERLRG